MRCPEEIPQVARLQRRRERQRDLQHEPKRDEALETLRHVNRLPFDYQDECQPQTPVDVFRFLRSVEEIRRLRRNPRRRRAFLTHYSYVVLWST